MWSELKAEVRKLLSVRSTYILTVIALIFVGLFAYFGTSGGSYEQAVCEPTGEVLYGMNYADERLGQTPPEELCEGEVLYSVVTSRDVAKERLLYNMQEAIPLTVTFATIIVILLMAHEYRYNLINYTLTISNSRSKVLAAKIILSILLTTILVLLSLGVSTAVTYAAVHLKDLVLPAQDYGWLYIVGRHLTYALGYTLFFLAITVLVRNLTASIAVAFVLPTVDTIGGFLLASRDIEPTKVLPFTALDRFGRVASDIVGNTPYMEEGIPGLSNSLPASVLGSLAVFGAYFIGVWLVAWILFLKRDAN